MLKFRLSGSVPVNGAVTAKLRSIVAVWPTFRFRAVSLGTMMWISPGPAAEV